MFVNFESQWFQSYCQAVLETEPALARLHMKDSLSAINDRLQARDTTDAEREAMTIAIRYLGLLDNVELPQAS